MPRIVFDSADELKEWCKLFVKDNKYTGYITEENELILEPQKSTRPIRYAYIKCKKAKELAEELKDKYNIPVIKIKSYEWDTEKYPGIKVLVE